MAFTLRRAIVAGSVGLSLATLARSMTFCKDERATDRRMHPLVGAASAPTSAAPVASARFAGRTYVVTGGTSGVGEAVAMRLATEGAAGITIVGRNESRGAAVVAKLGALGCEAQFVHAEMGSVDDVTAIVPAHVKAFGSLDGLANCAGDTSRGSIQSQTAESWDQLMAVNARAPFLLVQAASNTMRELGTAGGSIVNIITITSHGGQPYLCGYAASKGACATLTRNAAHALRHDRIRVNGINIGWTNSAAEHLTQVASGAGEDWLAKAVEKVPFGRLVEPADVAALTAFLLSAESGVMTGSVIDMDQIVIGAYD